MDLTWKSITELSRELRKNPTPAEKRLWSVLRRRQLNGYKFLRQKPLIYKQDQHKKYFYIADFYCAKLKLVIELDGKIHKLQKNEDLKDLNLVFKKILEFAGPNV